MDFQDHFNGFFKQATVCHSIVFQSVGLEWDLIISISKNFSNHTDIAGLGFTL